MTLSIKRGRRVESSGINLPMDETIKSLDEDGAYKYLGVLEADNIKHNKIKKEIIKEYVARCHQIYSGPIDMHMPVTKLTLSICIQFQWSGTQQVL